MTLARAASVSWPLRGAAIGTVLVGVAYLGAWRAGGAPSWCAWTMIVGVALLLSGSLALGATRRGRLSVAARVAALFLFLWLVGCFGAALALPDDRATLWLGLPVRTAIVLVGVGLVPLAVLPILFARDFATDGEDDAERLIAACRAARETDAS